MTRVSTETVRAMVRAEIRKFADDVMAEAIGRCIGEMAREVEARFVAKLEEATKEFAYKGVWTENTTYRRGNFVSMGGQVYHCNADTKSRPGTDSSWSLACKSGRDGRDGRDVTQPKLPPAPQKTASSHR